MINYNKSEISYRAKLFGYSYYNLNKMMIGEKGEGKKLLAYIIMSYDMEFISLIKSQKDLYRDKRIDYMTLTKIETYFEFRTGTVFNWISKDKDFLRRCLLHTPESYILFYKSFMHGRDSLMTLFPKALTDK